MHSKSKDSNSGDADRPRRLYPTPITFCPLAFLAGVAATLLFGVIGFTRTLPILTDFDFFYVAGQLWLEGSNPYLESEFAPAFESLRGLVPDTLFLSYPPQAAPVFMVFALLPRDLSGALYIAFSLACLFAIGLAAARMVNESALRRPATGLPENAWLLTALVLVVPETWTGLHLGQVTPWIGVALLGSWMAYRERRYVLAGIFCGIVTVKPQLAVLPFVWFALDRQWKLLAVAAITSLALAAYPLIHFGPRDTIVSWLHALSQYHVGSPSNTLGHPRILGLPSVLAALGGPAISPFAAMGIGGVMVVLFFRCRSRLLQDDYLGILLGIQVAVVYGRDHEILLLAPMAAAFWLHLRHRPSTWPVAALVLLLIAIPERAVGLLGVPLLLHWRTVTLLFCLGSLVYLSAREKQSNPLSKQGKA